ncbi:thiol S-methyltransferase TMT1B-like [Dermacentor albipictus]|uniref:thiol S-methyltransferase TMT1B-like n=1 Tax=Dermacentor albipictus TaxID=60249 RepID=UPI0038FBEF7A
MRRDVLMALNGIESHDPELRSEGAIRVLEIGAGIEANFEMIGQKMKYWNIDPNTDFQNGFLEELRKNPKHAFYSLGVHPPYSCAVCRHGYQTAVLQAATATVPAPAAAASVGKQLVHMERCVVGYGENMKEVPDNHFDVVLTTHVFCSVQCSEKVLQECRRVLVNGGRLVFMEHVALPKGTMGRFLQNLVAPLWRLIVCGCNPNRDSGEVVNNAGFSRAQ